MKFTASRVSEGNKLFPAEILIEDTGLTVKIPGLFSGRSEYFDYNQISNVSVNSPLIGYSTITFHAAGARVSAHGFTSSEVDQIKQAMEEGKSRAPHSNRNVVEFSSKEEKVEAARIQEENQKREYRKLRAQEYKDQGKNVVAFFVETDPIYLMVGAFALLGGIFIGYNNAIEKGSTGSWIIAIVSTLLTIGILYVLAKDFFKK